VKFTYLIVFLSFLCISCGKERKASVVWEKSIPTIGSQSSPLASDLNGDGILDIVIGAGQDEYQKSTQGVLAIDGLTGDIIWQAPCTDQIFGSPTFNDINSDNIEDIVIGGRSSQLYGLNGLNGERIWQYNPKDYSTHPILKYANKNFYNSVLVPDCKGYFNIKWR
jgi:outer membrane protein assembly factor BamB